MHILFKKPDPRAGTTARMDSSRGQHFIDTGAAVQVREDGSEVGANPDGDRLDGPTVAEFVAAGYKAVNYPPTGYASRSTAEEIEAAIAAQKKPSDGLTVAQLREALTAKGIAVPESVTKKSDLAALLDAEVK